MVTLEVYSKSVKVKYKAFLLSKATFIALSCGLLSLILPFVFCYETGGFWQKRDVVHEQPDVKFKGDFLFLATTTDNQKPISCSSFSYYNKYTQFLDTCSIIKVRESDENHDGKVDFLHVMISAKLANSLKVTSFQIMLPLNYTLHLPCAFHIESMIIYQQLIVNSVSKVSVYADLELSQSEPLICSKYNVAINNNNSPILDNEENFRRFTLEHIIAKYAESKIKTTLNNVYTTFNPIDDDTFTISLAIKYPEHKIYFKPRLWQIVKFAWIQYIAIYVLISWIIFQIKSYIFRNNLVLLYEHRPNTNK